MSFGEDGFGLFGFLKSAAELCNGRCGDTRGVWMRLGLGREGRDAVRVAARSARAH